jgi:hypothetical protein
MAARKTSPRSRKHARRAAVDTPVSPDSMTKASVAVQLVISGISSKANHEAAKAAGQPVFEMLAGKSGGDFYGLGGMLYLGNEGVPVTGKLPIALADFLQSQPKRRRPKNRMEGNIAKLFSVLNFRAQGHGVIESRIHAAQQIDPNMDADAVEAAEKKYFRAEKAVRDSRILKDFDRSLVMHNKCVMMKHKTATIDEQSDGVHLSGVFWIVQMGQETAKLGKLDLFLAYRGSGRKSGGTLIPVA